MEFTNSEVIKFQNLYQKRFGILLDPKTAESKLSRLVHQVGLIYKPIQQTDTELLKDVNRVTNEPPRTKSK